MARAVCSGPGNMVNIMIIKVVIIITFLFLKQLVTSRSLAVGKQR